VLDTGVGVDLMPPTCYTSPYQPERSNVLETAKWTFESLVAPDGFVPVFMQVVSKGDIAFIPVLSA